jgi:hypothetical protein
LGPEERKSVKLQQSQFQRLGWARKERWVIGHEPRRRRLEFQGCQCSWFVKHGTQWWLGWS